MKGHRLAAPGCAARAARAAMLASVLVLGPMGASQAQVPVRDLDHAARQSFQVGQSSFVVPTDVATLHAVASVPPGKRLVIEHVSFTGASGRVAAGGGAAAIKLLLSLRTSTNGVVADHALTVDRVEPSGFTGARSISFVVSQPMRAYADAGTGLSLLIRPQSDNTENFIVERLTVSGHLVDVP